MLLLPIAGCIGGGGGGGGGMTEGGGNEGGGNEGGGNEGGGNEGGGNEGGGNEGGGNEGCGNEDSNCYSGDASKLVPNPSGSGKLGFGPPGLAEKQTAAQNNIITVDYTPSGSNNITGDIYGAYREDALKVSDNTVLFKKGIANNVYGGYSKNGDAVRNQVVLYNGSSAGYAYGGYSGKGNVGDNRVSISAGAVVDTSVYGGYTERGNAVNNTVIMDGGTVMTANYSSGGIYGGATENGDATGNKVVVNYGKTSHVYGGYVGSHLVSAGNGDAKNNSVVINGGRFFPIGNINIRGSGSISGGKSQKGNATGNSVTITGGIFQTYIIGGSVSEGINKNATGNTVSVSGKPDLRKSHILGGVNWLGTGDVITGNTFNLHSSGIQVMEIGNFDRYNFYLPANILAGQTMLTVTHVATDISGSTIGVGIANGSSLLAGERVVLLNNQMGLVANGINSRAEGLQGIARIYDFDLTTDGQNLYATAVNPIRLADAFGGNAPDAGASAYGGETTYAMTADRMNPRVKALSEGRAAGLAFLTQGTDISAGSGLGSAILAANNMNREMHFVPFGVISGGSMRYNSGSHVDVSGFSLMAGLGWKRMFDVGELLLGGFVEAGWGDYDSYNSFSNAAPVKGSGDNRYVGGGILGRFDFDCNLYAEGSFRAGRATTDFYSNDLVSGAGNNASYDSSATYYGAHAGLGYIRRLSDNVNMDLSTKFLWTRLGGDSVNVAGDQFYFDASESKRWRTGARISYDLNKYISPYIGAYYEHEFSGKADAHVYGYHVPSLSLKGYTGIGEVGIHWKPSTDSPVFLEIAVQGYTGKREGMTGSVQVKFEF